MEHIRPNELAKRLDVSKSYVYLLMRFGEVPYTLDAGYKVIAANVAEEIVKKWTKKGRDGKLKDKRYKLSRKLAA